MGVLQNNIRKDIRFQKGDIILYEPNEIQKDEIKEILKNKLSINEQGEVKGGTNLRYIYRELTSIGNEIDNLTDDQFSELIDEKSIKYNRNMNLLYKEVIFLIDEISEDILYENIQQLKTINSMANIFNNNTEVEAIKNKLERLFKRKKINISVDEIIKYQNDTEKLKKVIEKATMPVNSKINKKSK